MLRVLIVCVLFNRVLADCGCTRLYHCHKDWSCECISQKIVYNCNQRDCTCKDLDTNELTQGKCVAPSDCFGEIGCECIHTNDNYNPLFKYYLSNCSLRNNPNLLVLAKCIYGDRVVTDDGIPLCSVWSRDYKYLCEPLRLTYTPNVTIKTNTNTNVSVTHRLSLFLCLISFMKIVFCI